MTCSSSEADAGVAEAYQKGGRRAHEGLGCFEERVEELVELVTQIARHCDAQAQKRFEAVKLSVMKRN